MSEAHTMSGDVSEAMHGAEGARHRRLAMAEAHAADLADLAEQARAAVRKTKAEYDAAYDAGGAPRDPDVHGARRAWLAARAAAREAEAAYDAAYEAAEARGAQEIREARRAWLAARKEAHEAESRARRAAAAVRAETRRGRPAAVSAEGGE